MAASGFKRGRDACDRGSAKSSVAEALAEPRPNAPLLPH